MDDIRTDPEDGKDFLYDLLEQLVVIAEGCGEQETAAILQEVVASHARKSLDMQPATDNEAGSS